MKGAVSAWDLGDVEEALDVCLFICTSAAINEERPEPQRDTLDVATRHISNALARVRDAQNQDMRGEDG